ncbi:YaaL family protein [Lederbergia citrea]|uniref:YaaL family protein n=1 Tax=Lederbergia citrea TaxID=2833581 RepID=A0A942UPB4_9BACI|nr:YaaL family protein [Lederbergia citrea]MBS4179762.1 YaaL family protein [Lederbergia citrea]MBS4206461.1 YaaL family protein [Lederbergia citrea]MBS4225081.1 YaaL family protein [Lederbergia citrea]
MFRKKKLRKQYDQKFIELMEATRNDWLELSRMEKLSYEQNAELSTLTKLAKAKYFFLFPEAKNRNIIIKR